MADKRESELLAAAKRAAAAIESALKYGGRLLPRDLTELDAAITAYEEPDDG